jgi:hypothetical protein
VTGRYIAASTPAAADSPSGEQAGQVFVITECNITVLNIIIEIIMLLLLSMYRCTFHDQDPHSVPLPRGRSGAVAGSRRRRAGRPRAAVVGGGGGGGGGRGPARLLQPGAEGGVHGVALERLREHLARQRGFTIVIIIIISRSSSSSSSSLTSSDTSCSTPH